jgi:hypothetical protein
MKCISFSARKTCERSLDALAVVTADERGAKDYAAGRRLQLATLSQYQRLLQVAEPRIITAPFVLPRRVDAHVIGRRSGTAHPRSTPGAVFPSCLKLKHSAAPTALRRFWL